MSMNNPQLPKVDCKYGAPMGRPQWADDLTQPARCFRLRFIDYDYDEGACYWGSPANVYCATNGEGLQQFTRASNRNEAKRAFKYDHPGIKWVN